MPYLQLVDWDSTVNYYEIQDNARNILEYNRPENFYRSDAAIIDELEDRFRGGDDSAEALLLHAKLCLNAYVPNVALRAALYEADVQCHVFPVLASQKLLWYLEAVNKNPDERTDHDRIHLLIWPELQKMLRHFFPHIAEKMIADTQKMLDAISSPKACGNVQVFLNQRTGTQKPDFQKIAALPDKNLFIIAAREALQIDEVVLNDDNITGYEQAAKRVGAKYALANSLRDTFKPRNDMAGLLRQKLIQAPADDYLCALAQNTQLTPAMRHKLCMHPVMLAALKKQIYDRVVSETHDTNQRLKRFDNLSRGKPPVFLEALHRIELLTQLSALLVQVLEDKRLMISDDLRAELIEKAKNPDSASHLPVILSALFRAEIDMDNFLRIVSEKRNGYSENVIDVFCLSRPFQAQLHSIWRIKEYQHDFLGELRSRLGEACVWGLRFYRFYKTSNEVRERIAKLTGISRDAISFKEEQCKRLEKQPLMASRLQELCKEIAALQRELGEKEAAFGEVAEQSGLRGMPERFRMNILRETFCGLDEGAAVDCFIRVSRFFSWDVRELLAARVAVLTEMSIEDGRLAEVGGGVLREERESLLMILRDMAKDSEAEYLERIEIKVRDVLERYSHELLGEDSLLETYPVVSNAGQSPLTQRVLTLDPKLVSEVLMTLLQHISENISSDLLRFYQLFAEALEGEGMTTRPFVIFMNRVAGPRISILVQDFFWNNPGHAQLFVQHISQALASLGSLADIRYTSANMSPSTAMLGELAFHQFDHLASAFAKILSLTTGRNVQFFTQYAQQCLLKYCGEGSTLQHRNAHPAVALYEIVRHSGRTEAEAAKNLQSAREAQLAADEANMRVAQSNCCSGYWIRFGGHFSIWTAANLLVWVTLSATGIGLDILPLALEVLGPPISAGIHYARRNAPSVQRCDSRVFQCFSALFGRCMPRARRPDHDVQAPENDGGRDARQALLPMGESS